MSTNNQVAKPADAPTMDEEPIATVKSNGKLRLFLLVVVPLVAIIIAVVIYLRGGRYVSTENAYVKSNVIAISSDISGRAVEVLVKENQLVSEGDVLFRLDANPLKLDVRQAQVQMDVARADIEALRAEHSEALVSVNEANARVEYLWGEFERQKSLKKQGLGGGQVHDEARFELRAAQQRVTVLKERKRKSLATFNGNPDLPVEEHPAFLSASVAYEMAMSQLAKTSVVAPADGIVSNVQLQAGEFVEAGAAVFSLIENGHVWVEANLKETQLTHIKEGQKAKLKVDAYPDIEWQATVASIAPATGAEFTVLPPQNATGNWVKVVQRVPVNLQVEAAADAPVLRAGMTVSVRIDTEHQRQMPAFIDSLVADDAQARPVRVVTQTRQQSEPITVIKTTSVNKPTIVVKQQESVAAPASTTIAGAGSGENIFANNRKPGLVILIEEQPPEQYTLELARADDISALRVLFDKLPDDKAVMLYQLQSGSGRDGMFGLAAGLFVTRSQADEALEEYSVEAGQGKPTVRQVGDVQKE